MEWTKAKLEDEYENAEGYEIAMGDFVARVVELDKGCWEWAVLDNGDPLEEGKRPTEDAAKRAAVQVAQAYRTIRGVREGAPSAPDDAPEILRQYPALAEAMRVKLAAWLRRYLANMEDAVGQLEAEVEMGTVFRLPERAEPALRAADIIGLWRHAFVTTEREPDEPIAYMGWGDAPLDDLYHMMGKDQLRYAVDYTPPTVLDELIQMVLAHPEAPRFFAQCLSSSPLDLDPLYDVEYQVRCEASDRLDKDPRAQSLAVRMHAALKARAELIRGLGRPDD